jgi:hypothetical protein
VTFTRWGTLVIVAALSCAACLNRPSLGPRVYTLDPPVPKVLAANPNARIIAVSRVDIAPQFDRRMVTYRSAEHTFERDIYATLAASPRELITTVLRGTLANVEFVSQVVELGGPISPELLVEGYVSDLEGDFSTKEKPEAVIALELSLLTAPTAASPVKVLFRKSYVRRMPVSEKSASATVSGWNEGLTSILQEFTGELRTTFEQANPSFPH